MIKPDTEVFIILGVIIAVSLVALLLTGGRTDSVVKHELQEIRQILERLEEREEEIR